MEFVESPEEEITILLDSPPPTPPPTPPPRRPPSRPLPPLPPSPPLLHTCRICFEIENAGNPLIYPCLCNGTSRFIHTLCLHKWRIMNYNKPPFFKCMECNFRYIIQYSNPKETFFYSNRNIQFFNSTIKMLVINVLLFICSLFLQTIDITTNFNLIYSIDKYPTKSFTDIIKSSSFYSHLFYYSFIIFPLSVLAHNIFLIASIIKINNRKQYWKKMFYIFTFHYIYSTQFIWLYYICKGNHTLSPRSFLNIELTYIVFYLYMFGRLLFEHNKILKKINSTNAGIVLNHLIV